MKIKSVFLTMSVINYWKSIKETAADLPPVGCLNQQGMYPKHSENQNPVIVLLESKLKKKRKQNQQQKEKQQQQNTNKTHHNTVSLLAFNLSILHMLSQSAEVCRILKTSNNILTIVKYYSFVLNSKISVSKAFSWALCIFPIYVYFPLTWNSFYNSVFYIVLFCTLSTL